VDGRIILGAFVGRAHFKLVALFLPTHGFGETGDDFSKEE